MNEIILKAISICRAFIGNNPIATTEQINQSIDRVLMFPEYAQITREQLFNELNTIYGTRIDNFQILEDRERRRPWLREFRASQESSFWKFWNRYKMYLQNQKNFPAITIQRNDELTDRILDGLFNPTIENIEICKKGLVVGQVQSGKTANYIGLICKAADAGFKIIIILAGIHNNLRAQTQIRIDEGFLGFDTSSKKRTCQTLRVGVGNIAGYDDALAHSYTTSEEGGDFTQNAANTSGFNFNVPQPIILVVKKNAAVLHRLHTWLSTKVDEGQNRITSKSLLIIDDEADNASINTNQIGMNPTVINNRIRDIIRLFNRSAYVGYTATPFANIFISSNNDDDLFPRDFIINIPAPSNYIGPERVFGTTSIPTEEDEDLLPIVNTIHDYSEFVPGGHRKDDLKPDTLPESLKTAIKCFIITCAIRRLRGQESKHNSMLVHVSRFQSWQNHIKELVQRQFYFYKQEIEANDPSVIEEFRRIFEEDINPTAENMHGYLSYCTISQQILDSDKLSTLDSKTQVHSWEDVKAQLHPAVQKIEVKSINGSSGDIIDYQTNENGISVIVIGGDKLSRGLTLEGLSVSYFLRASKMYDTLMQMGRWFGYRPGYVDLCRLFTSYELNEWFRHITTASNELREDFDTLAESGSTPDKFALKVRNHPGVLQITAVNRMRNATNMQVSWAGRLVETYQLSMDRVAKHKNFVATQDFLHSLGNAQRQGEHYLWRNVSPDYICNFFASFLLPQNLQKVNLAFISDYVRKLNIIGELSSWSVALLSKADKPEKNYDLGNGLIGGCWNRKRATDTNGNETYFIRKNHIVGNQTDEFIDLDNDMIERALQRTREFAENQGKTWEKNYPSPKIVREEFRPRTNPLLIIYPLNPAYANVLDNQGNVIEGTIQYNVNDEPFIGFAIAFPRTVSDCAISYAVNNTNEYLVTEDEFDANNDNTYDE